MKGKEEQVDKDIMLKPLGGYHGGQAGHGPARHSRCQRGTVNTRTARAPARGWFYGHVYILSLCVSLLPCWSGRRGRRWRWPLRRWLQRLYYMLMGSRSTALVPCPSLLYSHHINIERSFVTANLWLLASLETKAERIGYDMEWKQNAPPPARRGRAGDIILTTTCAAPTRHDGLPRGSAAHTQVQSRSVLAKAAAQVESAMSEMRHCL